MIDIKLNTYDKTMSNVKVPKLNEWAKEQNMKNSVNEWLYEWINEWLNEWMDTIMK